MDWGWFVTVTIRITRVTKKCGVSVVPLGDGDWGLGVLGGVVFGMDQRDR